MRGFLRRTWLLATLLLLAGCGRGYQLAPVSGRVLMDDKPLANAEVTFYPSWGKDLPISVGVTNEQGDFTLQVGGDRANTPGAVVGEHRVRISVNPKKAKVMPKLTKFTTQKELRELLPPQYNLQSKLTCTVPPEGKTDANFDLKSK